MRFFIRISFTVGFLFSFAAFPDSLRAQGLKLRNYSLGYRVFEISSIASNPFAVSHLLKDPDAYESFITSLPFTGMRAGGTINAVRTYYLNAEFIRNSSSRFWARHSILAGVQATNRIVNNHMSLENDQYHHHAPDTIAMRDTYWLTHEQQFLGGNLGFTRRMKLTRWLDFMTGIHGQASFTVLHQLLQKWDSGLHTRSRGWSFRETALPALQGKKYVQWQFMIPLAFEFRLYKNQVYLRVEGDAGYVTSKYTAKPFMYREAHGAGAWLSYRLP